MTPITSIYTLKDPCKIEILADTNISENPDFDNIAFVQSPDDPPKPSTSRQTPQNHASRDAQDMGLLDDCNSTRQEVINKRNDTAGQDGDSIEYHGVENDAANVNVDDNDRKNPGEQDGKEDTAGNNGETNGDNAKENEVNNNTGNNDISNELNNENYQYMDFYQRINCILRRCGVTFVGHLGAGKTCLKEALMGKPFSETQPTNGIELSTCTISKSYLETSETRGTRWEEKDELFYQHIYEDLDRTMAEGIHPEVDTVEQVVSANGRTSVNERNVSKVTLWDMSGEFAFYKTHQMFLFPSNVFLVIMDITKQLDADLPQSCATKDQKGRIRCPRTPREFLDYWLNTICTHASSHHSDDLDQVLRHIIIVLTHTDIVSQGNTEKIQQCKREILKHIKGQFACRYVYDKIFAVSNKERNEDEINNLQSVITELGKAKPSYGIVKPCTWLKYEADLQTWYANHSKKMLTIHQLQEHIAEPIRMTDEQVREFIAFHGSYGSLMSSEDSQVIFPDPQFLVDAFKAVITMWQFRDISHPNLQIQDDVENELESGKLSTNTLKMIWRHMANDDREIENLTSIMAKFGQFISCGDNGKWIVPALLPPCDMTKLNFQPFHEVGGAKPLQYLFHQSAEYAKRSAFLPSNFFQTLVASLIRSRNEPEEPWYLREMFFSAATFRAGEHREFMFGIFCYDSIVMLQAFAVEGEKDLPKLRIQFEKAIQSIVQDKFPCLHCSVCISPCDFRASSLPIGCDQEMKRLPMYPKKGCLQILGQMGKFEEKPLHAAVCSNAECSQRKHLATRHYDRWFNMNSDKLISNKLMRKVAKMVVSWEIYFDLGIELNITHETLVRKQNENPTSFVEAAYNVCQIWNNTTLGNSSQKSQQFRAAVEEIFERKFEYIVVADT